MLLRSYTGDLKNGDFFVRSASGVVVCGAYAVAPYTGDLKNGNFSVRSASGVAVCGTYAIRLYPAGRKFIGVLVRFYPTNQKSDRNWIHSTTGVAVYRAYAVAPYTGILKNGDFSICSTICMVARGAYAIRPYTDRRKFIGVLVRFYPGNEIITIFSGTRVGAYCIRPTNGHANGQIDGKMDGFLVRF